MTRDDAEYLFEDGEADRDAAVAMFRALGLVVVPVRQLPGLGQVQVGREHYIVEVDNDQVSWRRRTDWLDDNLDRVADSLDWPDFSKEFWSGGGVGWHATLSENVESIERNGLGAESRTRGMSNRWVGAAVFVTLDYDEAAYGSYGDAVFEIDFGAMHRDCYTPHVEQEPAVEDAERKRAVLALLGDDEYVVEEEQGMSPSTVIVHGHVPARYLRVVSG